MVERVAAEQTQGKEDERFCVSEVDFLYWSMFRLCVCIANLARAVLVIFGQRAQRLRAAFPRRC